MSLGLIFVSLEAISVGCWLLPATDVNSHADSSRRRAPRESGLADQYFVAEQTRFRRPEKHGIESPRGRDFFLEKRSEEGA